MSCPLGEESLWRTGGFSTASRSIVTRLWEAGDGIGTAAVP